MAFVVAIAGMMLPAIPADLSASGRDCAEDLRLTLDLKL